MKTHMSTDKVYEDESLPHRAWARPDEELGPLSFVAKIVDALLSRHGTIECPRHKCYPDSFEALSLHSPECCWARFMRRHNEKEMKDAIIDATIDDFGKVYQQPCMDAFNESFFVAQNLSTTGPTSYSLRLRMELVAVTAVAVLAVLTACGLFAGPESA